MITQDASTPAPTHQGAGTTGACQSAPFSPPSNSLVVVCLAWMFSGKGNHASSLAVHDSTGNNYAQGVELDNVQENNTAVYIFYYSAAPGAITVTATCTSTALASVMLTPIVLDGASSLQSGAGTTTDTDDANMQIVTTATGSVVFVVGAAPSSTRPPTPDVTITQIDLYADSAGTGNQAAAGQVTSSTGVPGKVWTGWTGNMAQGCGLEILPSPAVLLGTAGHPGPTWQIGQVLAAADVNTWILPLAQQKTAATSRKSTVVLTADPDLQLPFLFSGNWAVRAVIFFDGPNAADLQFSFSVPPGATLRYLAAYDNTSATPVVEEHIQTDVVVANTTASGAIGGIVIDGMLLMGATPGSLSFLWAQNVTNTTAVSVDQNSYIMAWRLG